jgi:hypothetical protein
VVARAAHATGLRLVDVRRQWRLDDLRSQRVGYYAARMLRGAKPADMPIEQPSRYERVLNMKSARTLGLNTPQSIQVQVDRTIS